VSKDKADVGFMVLCGYNCGYAYVRWIYTSAMWDMWVYSGENYSKLIARNRPYDLHHALRLNKRYFTDQHPL